MEKLKNLITPKKIILVWSSLLIFSLVWAILTSWPYNTLFGTFNQLGAFYVFVIIPHTFDWYSLGSCTLHPQASPEGYSPILYSTPLGLILGLVFIYSLIKNKQIGICWKVALIWSIAIFIISTALILDYFCFPMEFY